MMNEIEREIKMETERIESLQRTENGAVGYSTTRNPLVDLNFKVPSFRCGILNGDKELFKAAMDADLEHAIKWLFFTRDVREGLGEKRAFVEMFVEFYKRYGEVAERTVALIPEYGRWKDVFDILEYSDCKELNEKCLSVVKEQLEKDCVDMLEGRGISLLAKWMPSINASRKARNLATGMRTYLGLSNMEYRKTLSKLRQYIDVLERYTCGNKWGDIDYEKVPSKANLKYAKAFMRHDEERRSSFLDAVIGNKGEEGPNGPKINASVLYPYEIWNKYKFAGKVDNSYEALWENMKDMGDCGNTMVVCDGSGSMECFTVGSSKVFPIDVSRSLAVYFAEHCEGEFKNKFIEFSSRPRFIDINDCETLYDKIRHLSQFHDCSNTDIEGVFMLLLNTALKNGMTQSDMPERILIVSDMEFDNATTLYYEEDFKTLFENIGQVYEKNGFKLPKLVFWNVNSRTNTIPVTENEYGVILVSGFSVNIVKMVMSGNNDPWEVLKETLDGGRYEPVSKAMFE